MTDITTAMAPAISAMSAQYSSVVLGIVFTIACDGSPRLICSVLPKQSAFSTRHWSRSFPAEAGHLLAKPAREWSRGATSDIDGQAERPKRAGANESMLSE